MSRTEKPMVITIAQRRDICLRGAGKPLTPIGRVIRPEKGGKYSRTRDKDRTRREDY